MEDKETGAQRIRSLGTNAPSGDNPNLPSFNSDVSAAASSAPTQPLLAESGLTLSYTCSYDSETTGDVHLDVYGSSSVAGTMFNGVALTSSPTVVDTETASAGMPVAVSGFQSYLQGSHVTLVYLEMVDRTAITSASCHVDGLVLPSN